MLGVVLNNFKSGVVSKLRPTILLLSDYAHRTKALQVRILISVKQDASQ